MRSTLILLGVTLTIGTALFIFRPKNIEGPRAKIVKVEGLGFPYQALTAALKVVHPTGVNLERPSYHRLRQRPEALDHYLGLMSEVGPRSAPHRFTRRDQRLAYMLNAYTAGLLAIIRDHCPLESVESPYLFGGLFWRISLKVGGELMSLNDIAAEISTLALDDSRVMLAVSRAMRANLPLRQVAWTPENLEEGLAALEENLLKAPFVTRKGETLTLGAPFKWYEHRFLPSPRRYIEERRPELTEGMKRITFSPIDSALDGFCHD